MSHVCVLASDKELPLCDCQSPRTTNQGNYQITVNQGFKVEELNYYRYSVEELGYPMRPFRYEFTLEKNVEDLQNLRSYLEANFSHGEIVELWSVWVGDVNKRPPPRFQGSLEDFDVEALAQFLAAEEICFDITI